MTILRAQVEANERGLCRCGQRATSELSYAEEMDQRQDASSPSLPLSPPTNGSYQTPVTESATRLVPVPEDMQLPSPTSSEEEPIPVPPPRATTPGREVIDVDAAAKNTMVVFSAIEELRKDTEEGWKKLAVPLDQVIEANNASNIGLKKRDVQLARREDIMDGRVCANRVKIDELNAKVALVILDASVEY